MDVVGIDLGHVYTRVFIGKADSVCSWPTLAYVADDGQIFTGNNAVPYRQENPARFFGDILVELTDPIPLLPDSDIKATDLLTRFFSDLRQYISKDFAGDLGAVVAVPVYFKKEGAQWLAIADAVAKAGFSQVELVPSPQVVGDYYLRSYFSDEAIDGWSLVFDLGNTCSNVSLLEVDGQNVRLADFASTDQSCAERLNNVLLSSLSNEVDGVEALDFSAINPHDFSKPLALSIQGVSYPVDMEALASKLSEEIRCLLKVSDDLIAATNKSWTDINWVCVSGAWGRVLFIQNLIAAHFLNRNNSVIVLPSSSDSQQPVDDPMYVTAHGAALRGEKKNEAVKLYERQRNHLVSLLDDVLNIKSLNQESRQRLQKIQAKSLENQFEIVLIGEFQGGKSTTFNAICDGREISPRGVMIKTSACKISAVNISQPDQQEYAEIHWRSDEELFLGMSKILERHLRQLAPKRFAQANFALMMSEEGLSEQEKSSDAVKQNVFIDLHDAEDLKLIQAALDLEWAFYRKNVKSYSPDQLDVLRIASLIACHNLAPEIEQLRKKSTISIAELGRLVTFPMDWERRWQGKDAKVFQANEVVFAFVASVKCHIHSPNLARLGCVVTDCPGLFASRWDTEVARQAMFDADAILYLFGGDKTLSQGDIHSLNEIRRAKMEHKLFFAVNAKKNLTNITNNILPENYAKLEAQGFSLKPGALYVYQALLALCAKNGDALLQQKLDEYSQEKFLRVLKTLDEGYSNDFNEAWLELVGDLLRGLNRRWRVDDLSQETVKDIGDKSGFNVLLPAIEQTVVRKKAYSILVGQGGEKAIQALAELEGEFKTREEGARRSEAEFRQSVVKAREDLEAFQKQAREMIAGLASEDSVDALVNDFERSVFIDNVPIIAEMVVNDIEKNMLSLDTVVVELGKKLIGNKKSLENQLQLVFEGAILSVCNDSSEAWLENVSTGTNTTYNATIARDLNALCEKINQAWSSLLNRTQFSDGTSILEGLEIEFPDKFLSNNEELLKKLYGDQLTGSIDDAKKSIVTGVVLGLCAGVMSGGVVVTALASVATWASVTMAPFVLPFIALVVGTMGGLTVMDAMKGAAASKLRKKIEPAIREVFKEEKANAELRQVGRQIVESILKIYADYFQDRLAVQEEKFSQRIEKAKQDFESSEQDRIRLAEELKSVRTSQLAPVRQRIDQFVVKVSQLFAH